MTFPDSIDEIHALGEYDVLAPIGRGGMADVHAARLRANADRLVALKVIRPELSRQQGFVAMFLDEARIAARLSHPNIVTIYGLGYDDGRHYLAMELLRGRTLQELWLAANARGKRLPFAVAAWIGARVADALHHAHELRDEAGAPAQVVHRDVNPSNIFVCASGEPKVIDFGLAKARDRIGATAVGVVKGKLAYLSPEQVAGKGVDRRSDVFSLGVTLWEVTLDRRLFREDSDVATLQRVLAAHIPDPVSVDPDYPQGLAAVLRHALDPDPMTRFASADELARGLDAFVREAGGCNAEMVASLLAELFPKETAPAWELRAFPPEPPSGRPSENGSPRGRVQVWDEAAQKMTWMAVSLETIAGELSALDARRGAPKTRLQEIDGALEARIDAAGDDSAAAARAHLERSLVNELLGDGKSAVVHAECSLAVMDTPVAHAVLRRLLHARGAEKALLAHQDAELAAAVGEAERADRWAERGRLLRVAGGDDAEVRGAFERALSSSPAHAAALKGLEIELAQATGPGRDEALASHLARMADAYAEHPELAAWLHVERATVLDATDADAAREALATAYALDSTTKAVREACIAHAARRREWAWLADLLEAEAAVEQTPERAAGLELDAACVRRLVLRQEDRANELLERAAARAPTVRRIDARIADELVVAYERAGAPADTLLHARRRRLAYVREGRARAAELRVIAALEEARGDVVQALATLREARVDQPADPRAAQALDRLLDGPSQVDERIELLVEEAARLEGDAAAQWRAKATPATYLLRASAIAESRGDRTRAIEIARACLVTSPGHQGAIDALARLLSSQPTAAQAAEARERIAVHAHAAQHAPDPARRVAHLEAVALLTEEMLGDPALAAASYEAVLAVEPQRRTALVGLARTARRAGDRAKHVRALLDEAAIAEPAAANALRVEAAEALASSDDAADGDRALALTRKVLARTPTDDRAWSIEQRIHERAGRWGMVDRGLVARIEKTTLAEEKAALFAARGEVLRTRLGDPTGALQAFREAFALTPGDEELRRQVLELLELRGHAATLRAGLLDIANNAEAPASRVDALVRLAELDELVRRDDESARGLLDKALVLAPDDANLAERRARIESRLSRTKRALPTVEEAEAERAESPGAPHMLRWLEAAARREGMPSLVAGALAEQGAEWRSATARVGALFALLDLVEWTISGGNPTAVLDSILALAPDDRAALDARARIALGAIAQKEDPKAQGIDSLRRVEALAGDALQRLHAQLTLALALDAEETQRDPEVLREALAMYSAALAADPGSIVAAHGATRLGALLGDEQAFVTGTAVLAAVARPEERALRLTQAAAKLLASRDSRLGDPAARIERAFEWLEGALDAKPDSIQVAAVLLGARLEETHRDRLTAMLGRALERSTTPEAKVRYGTELARIARLSPPDRVLAIDALRKVVAAVPSHAPGWRALAEAALEQGATAEAISALESLAANATEPRARLAALFDLAELHRRRAGGTDDVERVLRAALDADPTSERAVRELLALRRAEAPHDEVTSLLARLAEAAQGYEARATVLGELADAYTKAGDARAAEQTLIEAAAIAPNAARLARVLDLHPDAAAQARVLAAVVKRGDTLGKPDPGTLVRLGKLEVEALGRPADGVTHLRRAVALSPTMHDARATLARGLVDAGEPADAVATVASMMVPEASPLLSLPEPAGALATLERAFAAAGQSDEALVARELRVVAGGLDDAVHVELRSRRLPSGTLTKTAGALTRSVLLSSVAPAEIAGMPLAISAALDGVETKLARSELDALRAVPRTRSASSKEEPLLDLLAPLAAAFGLEAPPLATSDAVAAPRVALVDGEAWVVAPSSLGSRPPPEQLTALVRPLVRIALGVPWLDELPRLDVHALLIAAARRGLRDYAPGAKAPELEARIDEMTKRVARVIGTLAFKQKKALGDLAEKLAAEPPIDPQAVQTFVVAVGRTEARAAFLLTGDLLATIDALRAGDKAFGKETDRVGPRALAGTFAHPIAGDLVRFAMLRQTTALRKRLGTASSRGG